MSETTITNAILKYLNGLECCRAIKVHGGYYGSNGEPDIDCVYRGRPLKIEVKVPGKVPTRLQHKRLDQWSEVGTVAVFVDNVAGVEDIIFKIDKGVL